MFMDWGTAGNFIDFTYAAQLSVGLEAVSWPITITAIDSLTLSNSPITHQTQTLTLTIQHHQEKVQFFVTTLSSPSLLFLASSPRPAQAENIAMGSTCQELCLKAKARTYTGEFEALEVDLETIPIPYHDLAEVFSKKKASKLPPHWTYDLRLTTLQSPLLSFCELWCLDLHKVGLQDCI